MIRQCIFVLSLVVYSELSCAQIIRTFSDFTSLYKHELNQAYPCDSNTHMRYRVCSNALRNEGNSPFILHHGKKTSNVIVLFHGLSDSPFFFRSIAQELHQQGSNVVVALLPGHGKKLADDDMEDTNLKARWHSHVNDVIALSGGLGDVVTIGGFSTGGALAVHHLLHEQTAVSAVMLFSAALQLSSNAEGMSRVWGIKWLAKIIDGEYQTEGPNPVKYPEVAGYAAMVLMDVIHEIRQQFEQGRRLNLPIFAVHSKADTTTLFEGVTDLLEQNDGENTLFAIDEALDVCHADVPISAEQLLAMHYDASQVRQDEKCKVPKANPVHSQMMAMGKNFIGSL